MFLIQSFCSYTEDIHRQRLFKEKKQPNKKTDDAAEVDEEVVTNSRESDIVHSAAMSKSLKIIERMVNQNTYDEVAQDFKSVLCAGAQPSFCCSPPPSAGTGKMPAILTRKGKALCCRFGNSTQTASGVSM